MELSSAVILVGAALVLWDTLFSVDVWEREDVSTPWKRVGNAWEFRRLTVVGAGLAVCGAVLSILGV